MVLKSPSSNSRSVPLDDEQPAEIDVAADESHPLAGLESDEDLDALTRAEPIRIDLDRRRQEPGIGGDDVKGLAGVEPEVVDPRVGRVENPEPGELARDLLCRPPGAVDQDVGTERTDQRASDQPIVIHRQLPGIGERPILDDQRDVVHAVGVRKAILLVGDDEHAGKPSVDMSGGGAVGVRVIPQRRRGLLDGEARRPGRARVDRLMGTAVGHRRELGAVPVHGGGLRKQVVDVERQVGAGPGADGWPEVVAVDAPRVGHLAGQELDTSLTKLELDRRVAFLVQQGWDLQRCVEANGAPVRDIAGDVHPCREGRKRQHGDGRDPGRSLEEGTSADAGHAPLRTGQTVSSRPTRMSQ